MILAAVVKCKPEQDCILPAATGNYVQAAFLDLVRDEDPALAAELHDDARGKPFTVSPLFGPFRPAGGANNHISADREYWFRVTGLNERVSAFILKAVNKNNSINIAGNTFNITAVLTASGGDNMAGIAEYAGIYDKYIINQDNIRKVISINFHSPTMFRSNGKIILLPQPDLMFYSVLEKWNRWSGIPLADNEFFDWTRENVVVSKIDIKSHNVIYKKIKYQGFAGRVQLTDISKDETVYRAIWNTLAEYSFWSGIGAGTAMGLGTISTS